MRTGYSDYIPLSQLPAGPSKPVETAHSYLFPRRRIAIFALFTTSLLALFAFLRNTLTDLDDDLTDLDLELLPSDGSQSSHTSYLPFQPSPRPTDLIRPSLKPVIDLPTACLDPYFARGELCYVTSVPKLDFLWTWVNGSDPLEEQAKQQAVDLYEPDDPWRPSASVMEARLYRDHDELRHSMRSVLLNFRKYAGRFFLLTSDFSIPVTTPNLTLSSSWRLGQTPQWLDLGKRKRSGWLDGSVNLDLLHHANIFRDYDGTVFNSLAIESQLGHVDGIADYFVYMNDDLYFAKPIMPATFYTSVFGIVLHMEPWLTIPPSRPTSETPGEWRGMGESNYILSVRFGARHRPYVMHQAKVVSSAMLAELETIWPDTFARSASHRFRETAGPGAPSDINTLFLHGHFIVERAREAMLWSWTVARIGGVDDAWGEEEARRAWEELGGTWGEETLEVRAAWRSTLRKQRVETALTRSGSKGGLGRTEYVFSSQDGYAYGSLGYGQDNFPSSTPDVPEESLPTCEIRFSHCFAGYTRASDVFRRIAFEAHECGDCVMSALVRASGTLGMSAFLPSEDRELRSAEFEDPPVERSTSEIPHLPLVQTWEEGDFSLQGVMGAAHEQNVRMWTLQLIQRYRYVIGKTASSFERLENPDQTRDTVSRLSSNHDVVLLCVNDDVTEGDDEVADMFRAFQDKQWGRAAAWEKD
ncbi:hypothetical protein POSPLADRAFT_1067806 [Postia placenta MAD-698-R-SB12]|uniref:Stealth protein CR3 conserved region 3 domain-containing protein n=1 Tax=Postia placenta MAD-698-R-SB12 TaxID=670580 RepID=A0A1X6MMY2_9APHY|nr:hypothetical protein POSPLADRAFT_1067806 [Postia placenta MAD-698-R-SB12]OSX57791.1 hypothetical protein POSPLADRAFT_1067806 [Postia placenta MAD-698-R-SB12]